MLETAAARDLPIAGGPGGRAFRANCSGQLLVGFEFRAGAFVDAIAPRCASLVIHSQTLGPTTQLIARGGRGGRRTTQECGRGRYVSGIKIGFTRDGDAPQYVDFVELICKSLRTGQTSRVCLNTGNNCPDHHPDRPALKAVTHECSANEVATGIHGRGGNFVDALGLVCAARPAGMKPPGTPTPSTATPGGATPGGGNPGSPSPGSATPGGSNPATPTPATPALPPDQQAMLDAHNAARAKHCVGALTWSAQAAAAAQQWANRCTGNGAGGFAHDSNRGAFGENLAWGTSMTAQRAVELWYQEVKDYNFASPAYTARPPVGHFTQMVWRATTQIGCATARCGGQNVWVCRYAPPGNFNVVSRPGFTAAQAQQSLRQNVPQACR